MDRVLPTLYPTATLPATLAPVATRPPQPTTAPATEVAFDQIVVDITYSIPALSLERRIVGNVAGEVQVDDKETGQLLTLKNRPGVIVEMQQALPKATIEDLPAGCDACVHVAYELPLTGEEAEGWLKDVQLLASLEHYTASVLGPHFPPGTTIGIRREATPFEVAHSVALTDDGQLWTWMASESEIDDPVPIESSGQQALDSLDLVDWESLPRSVGQICYQGGGREYLLLENPDGPLIIEVRCPELYLPGQLLPAYMALDEAIEGKLEGSDIARPELPMKLDSLVEYHRVDGARLTVGQGGRLSAIDSAGKLYTSTIGTTQVLSLTALLVDSPLLQAGPNVVFEEVPSSIILLRLDDGIYEIAWTEQSTGQKSVVGPWDRLLETLLQGASEEGAATPVATPASDESGGS